jgi:membrane fusion protein (multidrug efflux system)
MRIRLPAALLLACLLPALPGCSRGGSAPEAEKAVKPREAARVRTAPVEQREMVKTISTTTTVESEHEIKLYPRVSGVVTRLVVEEGSRVEAGAVLAELDRRATQSALEQARITVREAEDAARKAQFALPEAEQKAETARLRAEQAAREFERNEKAGLISAQQLDNLRVARDTARAEQESARLSVERTRVEVQAVETEKSKADVALRRAELDDSYMVITAPVAGVVAQRNLRLGDSAGPASEAFVLTDISALRAVVHRPQRELAMFLAALRQPEGAGLEIRATAEALPGRTFPGAILRISPSIDPQSGSFRVTVRLPPAAEGEAGLLPGMLVRLEIVTERHPDALVVPKRALRREGGTDMIFVVESGRARRVEVREGFSNEDSVEVLPVAGARVAAGERVVVVGNRELEDGAEVVEEAAPSAPAAPVPAASEAQGGASKG